MPGRIKTHGQSGPIEDAFLDEFICVRPTGKPWNDAVHQQSLKVLERFDRRYARWMRAHPRIVSDTDLTEADFRKFNVILFGDPGSNRWIAKLLNQLPVQWTKDTVRMTGSEPFPAASHYRSLIYPSPLGGWPVRGAEHGIRRSPSGYRTGDYSMPRYGDYGILKGRDRRVAGCDRGCLSRMFNERWR